MLTHYDLFAGIGGFSLALEEVFNNEEIKHIFCEWEAFPTAVLKKHWPKGQFYGDIADLVAYTGSKRFQRRRQEAERQYGLGNEVWSGEVTIVTGGFPCQPFSQAGRRRGTSDPRYQWPNMFAVIRNVKPEWVIAENVSGLATWNEGLVLETVCADLESEGYAVQTFIIPALATGAPHRRDRVWIIGYAEHSRLDGTEEREGVDKGSDHQPTREEEPQQSKGSDSSRQRDAGSDANSEGKRRLGRVGLERQSQPETTEPSGKDPSATNTRRQRRGTRLEEGVQSTRSISRRPEHEYPDWGRDWREVALATCNARVDDGLPREVDGVPYSFSRWRKESLKAYGNAIVPQVAMMIFQAIKEQMEDS